MLKFLTRANNIMKLSLRQELKWFPKNSVLCISETSSALSLMTSFSFRLSPPDLKVAVTAPDLYLLSAFHQWLKHFSPHSDQA